MTTLIMKRPLIAVPMDYLDIDEEPEAKWYSKYPWYGVKHRYHDALTTSGAIPCFIGYDHGLIPEYARQFDGLVITGGFFDHDPAMYNAIVHPTTKLRIKRSHFEMELLKAFLPTQKPILGICAGHQLINIAYGGTIIQDIPSQFTSDIKHTLAPPPTEPAHTVEIIQNTKLSKWYTKNSAQVNSSHHQGIEHLGKNLIANAISTDNLIEGIEDPKHPFCIGVQWHPEYFVDELDKVIFKQFVHSCA